MDFAESGRRHMQFRNCIHMLSHEMTRIGFRIRKSSGHRECALKIGNDYKTNGRGSVNSRDRSLDLQTSNRYEIMNDPRVLYLRRKEDRFGDTYRRTTRRETCRSLARRRRRVASARARGGWSRSCAPPNERARLAGLGAILTTPTTPFCAPIG